MIASSGIRALFCASALCCMLLAASTSNAALQQVNLGIYGGTVHDITAFNSSSGQSEILIAVNSIKGIFKWDPAAGTWSTVTWPAVVGKGEAVETNRASGYEDDVYAVLSTSSGNQVWASASGGATGSWAQVTGISEAAILLGHSTGMYVGTRDGRIYRSTGAPTDPFDNIYTFAASPEIVSLSVVNATHFFAMTRTSGSSYTGTLYSVNSTGGVFSAGTHPLPAQTSSGSATIEVTQVGVSPDNSSLVYIAGSSSLPQIFRSTDGAMTWSSGWDKNSPGSDGLGFSRYIKFSGDTVFCVARSIWANATNASNWTAAPLLNSTVGTDYVSTHANDQALEVDPNNATNIYMDTDWAVGNQTYYESNDSWTAGSEIGNDEGIEAMILNDFSFVEYNSTWKELWIASKSGVGRAKHFDPTNLNSTSQLTDWYFPMYPEGSPATSVAIDPTNTQVVLVGYGSGRIFRTVNGNASGISAVTWSEVFNATNQTGALPVARPDHTDITHIAFVPSSNYRAYMSAYNWEAQNAGGIWVSNDTGVNWTADNSMNGTPVRALVVRDNMVWAGVGADNSTDTGIRYRTSVLSAGTWATGTTSTKLDNQTVMAIDATTIATNTTVYLGTKGGVYKGFMDSSNSTCSGFNCWTFSSLTANINASVGPLNSTEFVAVTVQPADPNNAYVARENCIYETTDGGLTWAVYGSSCSDTHEDVRVLKYDELLAGTVNGLYGFEATGSSDSSGSGCLANPEETLSGETILLALAALAFAVAALVKRRLRK